MNPNCAECSGTGWKVISCGGVEGVTKCQCRTPATEQPKTGTPITAENLAVALRALTIFPDFPRDDIAQAFTGRELNSMCRSTEDLDFVILWAPRLYAAWRPCGNPGLRQILCHRSTPKDGYQIDSTETYPDGISRALGEPEAPQYRRIASGEPASTDPEMDQLIGQAMKRLPDTGPPMAPIRRAKREAGEPYDAALRRAFDEDLARPVPKPRLPTEDEIAEIKRKQAEAAKEDATRAILSKGESA